jgi:hypothetical protein
MGAIRSSFFGALALAACGGQTPAVGGPPDLNESLTRVQIEEVMAQLEPAARACFVQNQVPGDYATQFVVLPAGQVATAQPTVHPATEKPAPDLATAQCIATVIKEQAVFPAFTGRPVPVVYPYRFD